MAAFEPSEDIVNDVGDSPAPVFGSSDAPEAAEQPLEAESLTAEAPPRGKERRHLRDRLAGAAVGAVKTYDNVRRSMLEAEEPDASGKWSPEHRRKVLRYVYERDGGRCGVCGAETRIEAAHVEHIVPKNFAYFDSSKAAKAVQGTRYKSLLHKLVNLQASHTYYKNKGNTADVTRWRHPTMPPPAVALGDC